MPQRTICARNEMSNEKKAQYYSITAQEIPKCQFEVVFQIVWQCIQMKIWSGSDSFRRSDWRCITSVVTKTQEYFHGYRHGMSCCIHSESPSHHNETNLDLDVPFHNDFRSSNAMTVSIFPPDVTKLIRSKRSGSDSRLGYQWMNRKYFKKTLMWRRVWTFIDDFADIQQKKSVFRFLFHLARVRFPFFDITYVTTCWPVLRLMTMWKFHDHEKFGLKDSFSWERFWVSESRNWDVELSLYKRNVSFANLLTSDSNLISISQLNRF